MSVESAQEIKTQSSATIFGVPEGQDAFVLRDRAVNAQREGLVAMHVVLDDARMTTLADLLSFFAPDVDVLIFPAWDCLPYDRVSPNNDVIGQRIETLMALSARAQSDIKKPLIVLTTVNAITGRVVPHKHLNQGNMSLSTGGHCKQDDLIQSLSSQGYLRTDVVREPSEFAVRGGIVDLFPPSHDNPIRIDFFGDDIETMRAFDANTQRSLDKIDHLNLGSVAEVLLNDDSIQKFRSRYREMFGIQKNDPLYESVSEGRRYAGMEHWMPLFFDHLETLFDYAPDAHISFDYLVDQARIERHAQVLDIYQARQALLQSAQKAKTTIQGAAYQPILPDSLFINDDEWQAQLKENTRNRVILSLHDGEGENANGKRSKDFLDIRTAEGTNLFQEVGEYITALQANGKTVFIAAYSKGALERLKTLIEQADIKTQICENFEGRRKLKDNQIGLIVLGLEKGFINDSIAVITEYDILGDRLARRSKNKKKSDAFLREVSSLTAGDLIVHVDHGVGKFEGLETVSVGDALHDCLKLIYDGGDKLFIPVENIEMLSRFGGDEGTTKLDRLGGVGWQTRKSRVKKDLLAMAGKLLEIAAERQVKQAEVYDVASTPYPEFAARFPYAETEDQQRSIDEILKDLAKGQPMDRLVCGDVGFGKTEVALRAAFVTAMAGGQVAVVVPTTLLARQHTENFEKRFAGFPLKIRQLSRFVNAKDMKKAKNGLADGSVNIVIGTHALLAPNIKFDNLGLVVVDEEQRFGVKQKEKLKDLRKDVHVLTLTATPIPRTLQLSLSGVRDMSLITTPPVDRLAVRTFVMPYDPLIIREAILREHYRGGQSFFVCPRIKDLREMEDTFKELVPEVKVITAHGQLSPGELEDRMTAFYERQYDVLMATNIIESGLDVPTANTMIVHRADLFGLAQLYQIRGRVGRSKVRAYAYLTWKNDALLSDTAQRRLEVIGMLDTLGSGFQLASHDMDIRGAGNLLGEQQSGHIREVGVELYQQMLEEAVEAARAGAWLDENDKEKGLVIDNAWSPQINVGVSVMIPDDYVRDLGVRMSLYRRLSTLEDQDQIDGFAAELIDRFGPIPDMVENLLMLTTLKAVCKRAGIETIDAGPKGVIVSFRNNTPPNPDGVIEMINTSAGTVKLRPDQKLFYARILETPNSRMKCAQKVAQRLAEIAAKT